MGELMRYPDLTSAFILASNIALLASRQEQVDSEGPSGSSSRSRSGTDSDSDLLSLSNLVPRNTTHLLGHGFIGALSCLVAIDRISLPDATRLAARWGSLRPVRLPPTSSSISSSSSPYPTSSSSYPSPLFSRPPPEFLTTLMAVASDPSKTRRHSLTDLDFLEFEKSIRSYKGEEPMVRSLRLVRDMQLQQGWSENIEELNSQGYMGAVEQGGQGGWETDAEHWKWAGEAQINCATNLVLSGTKGEVIKLIDKLRSAGLATPVIDLLLP